MNDLMTRKRNGRGNLARSNNVWDVFDKAFNALDIFEDFDKMLPTSSLLSDIEETENEYIVKAEVPGLKQDNINIDYNNDVLTISAKYEEKSENSFRSGSYSRSFYINDIDIDKSDAKLDSGILRIKLPKSEQKKAKKIKIN